MRIFSTRGKKMIKLGQTVIDKVTGFKGIVIGRAEHLYGCTTVGVKPKVGDDGKVIDTHWFDEPALKVIKEEKPLKRYSNNTGGPLASIPKSTHNM